PQSHRHYGIFGRGSSDASRNPECLHGQQRSARCCKCHGFPNSASYVFSVLSQMLLIELFFDRMVHTTYLTQKHARETTRTQRIDEWPNLELNQIVMSSQPANVAFQAMAIDEIENGPWHVSGSRNEQIWYWCQFLKPLMQQI